MDDEDVVRWEWAQWELVGIQHHGPAVVLDVIEVATSPWEADDRLMSVTLMSGDPTDDLEPLAQTLEAWVSSDAVCDVIRTEAPGSMALFQDSQLLVFATV
jgi:hypothetical protein